MTDTDWTAVDGRANSSPAYLYLCDVVERQIRDGAHSLLAGQAGTVARLIVSKLAHEYGLAPAEPIKPRLIWDEGFVGMTLEQAKQIRHWRIEIDEGEGTSWRGVAQRASAEWGGDWGSNQIAGMALCKQAALILGEDDGMEPWS